MGEVSVAMATYNGRKYIAQQVQSILEQLGSSDELVISDDGSTDGTWEYLVNYKDPRIKLFKNNRPCGIAKNFENALHNCSNRYIFLADQDDIWLPTKVEVCLAALQKYPCVLHNAAIIDENAQRTGTDLFQIYKTRSGFLPNLMRNTFVGCCMAFRQDLLSAALPIPSGVHLHDMWLGLQASLLGEVLLVNEPLMEYRRHGGNASTTGNPSKNSLFFQMKYRIILLKEILKRNATYGK